MSVTLSIVPLLIFSWFYSDLSGEYRLALIFGSSIQTTLQSIFLNTMYSRYSDSGISRNEKLVIGLLGFSYPFILVLYIYFKKYLPDYFNSRFLFILLLGQVVTYSTFLISLHKSARFFRQSFTITHYFIYWSISLILNIIPLIVIYFYS